MDNKKRRGSGKSGRKDDLESSWAGERCSVKKKKKNVLDKQKGEWVGIGHCKRWRDVRTKTRDDSMSRMGEGREEGEKKRSKERRRKKKKEAKEGQVRKERKSSRKKSREGNEFLSSVRTKEGGRLSLLFQNGL